jgi:hypothetical protein
MIRVVDDLHWECESRLISFPVREGLSPLYAAHAEHYACKSLLHKPFVVGSKYELDEVLILFAAVHSAVEAELDVRSIFAMSLTQFVFSLLLSLAQLVFPVLLLLLSPRGMEQAHNGDERGGRHTGNCDPVAGLHRARSTVNDRSAPVPLPGRDSRALRDRRHPNIDHAINRDRGHSYGVNRGNELAKTCDRRRNDSSSTSMRAISAPRKL